MLSSEKQNGVKNCLDNAAVSCSLASITASIKSIALEIENVPYGLD